MSDSTYEKGIRALQDLLPIEDCINCGAEDTTKERVQLIAKKPPTDFIPEDHPNLIR